MVAETDSPRSCDVAVWAADPLKHRVTTSAGGGWLPHSGHQLILEVYHMGSICDGQG